MELPQLGHNPDTVEAVTEPGHPVYARLFLPLSVASTPTYLSWSAAAAAVQLALTATTTWEELTAPERHPDPRWELPRGTVDAATAEAVVAALTRGGVPASTLTSFVLWEGYAGELDDDIRAQARLLPATGKTYLNDGSFWLYEGPLDWILTRTYRRGCHVPGAFWPADRSFLVATALYQDSLYLSCGHALLDSLRDAGPDVLPIERGLRLPSRGD